MADIELEGGVTSTRAFTLMRGDDTPAPIDGVVTFQWRRDTEPAYECFTTAEVLDPAEGRVSVTFDTVAMQLEVDGNYVVRFVVDPAPPDTNGRFPEASQMTMHIFSG